MECYCGKDSISYFPNLPQICHRGSYVLDGKRTTLCTKKSKGHPTLAPGMFTIGCQHGNAYLYNMVIKESLTFVVLYFLQSVESVKISIVLGITLGYQIMDTHEGPNIPYTILRTRFSTGKRYSNNFFTIRSNRFFILVFLQLLP